MYQAFHRHVLLAGFETLYKRRRTFRYLRQLEGTQWLGRNELEAIQLSALRNLLAHAFSNCPYYREQWQRLAIDPGAIQSLGDFRTWPVLERSELRKFRVQMRATDGGGQLISKSTGGSSGEPVHFDLNLDSNDRRVAATYRGYGWAGALPGTRQLHLWGVPLVEGSRRKRLKDSIYHRLHRRQFLSTFGLSDVRFQSYFDAWNAYQPQVVVAYTGSLYDFARMIQERGLRPFSPRSLVVGAEKLHGFQRELIERVFEAPVFETYGSREFMLIGAECERHEGLHLTQENLLVEILEPDGTATLDGDEGEVVITDLYNYGMPFIRYRTGDRAVAGFTECSCGRGLPLLKAVSGRVMDTLTTPDGRRISGAIFPHLLKDFASVRRFQVVQDRPNRIELRVVATTGWEEQDRANVDRIIRAHLGPAVTFDLVRVDEIPLTGAGKLRVVVNRCDPTRATHSGTNCVNGAKFLATAE